MVYILTSEAVVITSRLLPSVGSGKHKQYVCIVCNRLHALCSCVNWMDRSWYCEWAVCVLIVPVGQVIVLLMSQSSHTTPGEALPPSHTHKYLQVMMYATMGGQPKCLWHGANNLSLSLFSGEWSPATSSTSPRGETMDSGPSPTARPSRMGTGRSELEA